MIRDMLVRSVSLFLFIFCVGEHGSAMRCGFTVGRGQILTEALTELGGAMFSPDSVLPGAAEKKMVGSVMFFQADTIEEVKKTVESDVYYTSGVVSLISLY